MNRTQTLDAFWHCSEVSPKGVVHFDDGRSSIVMRIHGIDPRFLAPNEWQNLASSWRSLLRLTPQEEVQIIYSKSCDFESVISSKLEALGLTKNKNAKALLLKGIDSLLEDVDPNEPKIFSTKILWIYSKTFLKTDTVEMREAQLLQKHSELAQLFEESRLSATLLSRAEVMAEIFRAAHGSDYRPSESASNDWPHIEIYPSEIEVEKKSFRTLTLQTLPERFSSMGMILALTSIPATFDLVLRFQGRDSKELYENLDRKRRVLFGMVSKSQAGDLSVDERFKELNDVLSRLNQSNDSLLNFGLTLGVRGAQGSDFLQRWTLNEFLNAQTKLGFAELKEPYLGAFDAYLETIPTFRGYKMCPHTTLSSNAVHFLPLFEPDRGDSRAIATYRTIEGGLFSIDPSNYRQANFNWLISGTSGSGKSFFVNSLLLQSQPLNPKVFIVDIGGSYTKLTNFFEGRLIDFDTRSSFNLSPFFLPRSSDIVTESKRREHIQMVFWEMMRDQDQLPTIEEKAALKDILLPYFESESLCERPITAIRDDLKRQGYNRMSLLLDRWCAPSFYGNFLDSNAILEFDNPIMTFDLKGLNEFGDLSRVVQFIICSGLWAAIQRDTRNFGFVVLDEVAFTLLKAQPSFVDELISTVRKYNTSVIVITQDLEKVTSNPAGASILQNTQVKAILQQRGDPKNFSEPLQLNEEDLRSIRQLSRRKGSYSDVFLLMDDRRAVIRYAPNLFEYLISTTVPQENADLNACLNRQQGTYPERFLAAVKEMTR